MQKRESGPLLVILSGLPGAGKTSIARELARQIGATHVRVDTIEVALLRSQWPVEPVRDHGYVVAYAVAEDNLRLGRVVVADSVNPMTITRDAWRAVALRAGAGFFDVEVVCTDPEEHRRRVETRISDIAGHKLPTWNDVLVRQYDAWESKRLVVDTGRLTPFEAASVIRTALGR